jgi:beta-lactamase regulating signal transducer with metallopeptidase domain
MNELLAFLADWAMRSSIVLVAGFATTFLLRKRSASLRHSIWSACLIAAVLLPGLTEVMSAWNYDFNLSTITRFSPPLKRIEIADSMAAPTTDSATTPAADRNQLSPGVWVWLCGVVVIALTLIREAARLAGIARSAAPFFDSRWFQMATEIRHRFHMKRSVRLVQSAASMLVTWGAVRPQVLLPCGAASWTDRRIRSVLGHEMAHIRRHDWSVQLIGETARAMYWFNPLVWFACSRLRQESERACDDAVLGLGMESTEYAAELLDLARILKTSTCSWAPSLAMGARLNSRKEICRYAEPIC